MISNEKKKEILLESFDIIKDNYSDNQCEINALLAKMFKIDVDCATEMWIYLLDKHKDKLSIDGALITSSTIHDAQEILGREGISNIVVNNEIIKKSCFLISNSTYMCDNIISSEIYNNNLDTANELLSLIYQNKNKEDCFYNCIKSVIQYYECESINEQVYELFNVWVNKMDNKEDVAKLKVYLIDFM